MSHLLTPQTMEFLQAQTPEKLEVMRLFIEDMQAHQNTYPNSKYVKSPMHKKPKSAVASRARAPKLGVQPPPLHVAAKRPLNSWMAFRSYYKQIFNTYQQKIASGYLTLLWRDDPFQAKWSIVAKGYSVIRSKVNKDAAPLGKFLELVCPHIGLICPEFYLVKLGWYLSEDRVLLKVIPTDQLTFTEHESRSTLSAADIVEFCNQNNYVAEAVEPTTAANAVALTMAANPDVAVDNNTFVDAASFGPLLAQTNATESEQETNPIVDYETNNILLATAGDVFPFNNQFDNADLTAGFGLYYDPNAGDEFNAFEAHQSFNINDFIDPYDVDMSQYAKNS